MPIERIDPALCNGCGICVDSCPVDVIRMDDKSEKAIIKYRNDCMACYVCDLDCPTGAIMVSPDKDPPTVLSWG